MSTTTTTKHNAAQVSASHYEAETLLDHLIETDAEDMTTRVWHRLDDRLTAVDALAKGVEEDLDRISRAVAHEAATVPAGTERMVAISHHDWVRLLQALSNHPKALLDVAALNIMCEDITK